MDPLFGENPQFHSDILAYQITQVRDRKIILLGEQHVLPTNASTHLIDPLERIRASSMPILLYAEMSPQMKRIVHKSMEKFLEKEFPFFPQLPSLVQTQIIEGVDQAIYSKQLRLERLCLQVTRGLWPFHISVLNENIRHETPFNVLGWLTPGSENVEESLKNVSRQENVEWSSLQRMFERNFLHHIQDLPSLHAFFTHLIFVGQAPPWYMEPFNALGISLTTTQLSQAFQASPIASKRRIQAFFEQWFRECIAENQQGHLLSYLSQRQSRFESSTIGEVYPLTRELFSYMQEIIMDIQILVDYEANKRQHKTHVIYTGARHTHRLGAYFGGIAGAASRSWHVDGTWQPAPLPFKRRRDDLDLNYVLGLQLQQAGGAPLPKNLKRAIQKGMESLKAEMARSAEQSAPPSIPVPVPFGLKEIRQRIQKGGARFNLYRI